MSKVKDFVGSILGLAIFGLGLYLLWNTFQFASSLYLKPPAEVLGVDPKKSLDVNNAGSELFKIVIQSLGLILMSIVASIIAQLGIKMYSTNRMPPEIKELKILNPVKRVLGMGKATEETVDADEIDYSDAKS